MLTYRAVVAIISLVFYGLALPICFSVFYIQGPGNNSAFFWLTVFACVRITGFGLQLYAETTDHNANSTYYTGVAVLLNIGLSPLLLSSAGMLSRVQGAVGKRMGCILSLVTMPILLALALLVAGSIDPTSQAGPTFSANGEIKAAVALYLVCFIQLCYATAVIFFRNYLAQPDDRKLALVVLISLPFMLVRVLYIVLFAFATQGGSSTWFNVISGDETTQLCMQVVQEYIIVFFYLRVGVTMHHKPERDDLKTLEDAGHPEGPCVEKRGPVKRVLRYLPISYWFITLREITKTQLALYDRPDGSDHEQKH